MSWTPGKKKYHPPPPSRNPINIKKPVGFFQRSPRGFVELEVFFPMFFRPFCRRCEFSSTWSSLGEKVRIGSLEPANAHLKKGRHKKYGYMYIYIIYVYIYVYVYIPWKSKHQFFIGWFRKHPLFWFLVFQKLTIFFFKWWQPTTSRGICFYKNSQPEAALRWA